VEFFIIKKSFKLASQPFRYNTHFISIMFHLISLAISILAGIPQNNLIHWNSGRKLSWKDFQAQPDKNSTNAALTNSSINIEFGYSSKGLKYNIKCRFDQNLSWGRIKNDYILAHEQGHFDIAEIHARKLNKAMKSYKFDNRTVGKDVNKIYDTVMKNHHAFQSQYDGETNYSRDAAQQNHWKIKIEQILEELNEYRDYH